MFDTEQPPQHFKVSVMVEYKDEKVHIHHSVARGFYFVDWYKQGRYGGWNRSTREYLRLDPKIFHLEEIFSKEETPINHDIFTLIAKVAQEGRKEDVGR